MNRVLITGAAGFIGSSVARTLLENGDTVIGVDNFVTGQPEHIKTLKQFPLFTFIKHDIVMPFPQQLTEGRQITALYHLACPTGVPNLTTLGEEMLLTSSYGTRNVLELARIHSAKVVFTSSSEVYGNPMESPQKETYTGNVDPVGIRSTYEEGKRFAEALVMLYVRKHKLNASIARVFNVYGPGMAPSETRVIPRMITCALAGRPIPLHGEGIQTRTFCYVDDLTRGLILLMKKGKRGEVYNIGSDQEIRIKDLANLIQQLTQTNRKLKILPRPAHDHDTRRADLTKIKTLGWVPEVLLPDGLQRTVEYFKHYENRSSL